MSNYASSLLLSRSIYLIQTVHNFLLSTDIIPLTITGAWGMDFVSSSPLFSKFSYKSFLFQTVDTEYTYYS